MVNGPCHHRHDFRNQEQRESQQEQRTIADGVGKEGEEDDGEAEPCETGTGDLTQFALGEAILNAPVAKNARADGKADSDGDQRHEAGNKDAALGAWTKPRFGDAPRIRQFRHIRPPPRTRKTDGWDRYSNLHHAQSRRKTQIILPIDQGLVNQDLPPIHAHFDKDSLPATQLGRSSFAPIYRKRPSGAFVERYRAMVYSPFSANST